MGLFDFLKKNSKSTNKRIENKFAHNKSVNVKYLDEIQKEVYQFLKPLGFRKRGRTFNRQTETGVFQVINFQSGQYPIGDNYVIPDIRENFYGKFNVNMGVIVEELYGLYLQGKEKNFYQEYDCQIRLRLSQLIKGSDYWWDITDNSKEISTEIIKGLEEEGLSWLNKFETRDKICKNWGNDIGYSDRAKLDVAIIIFQKDKKKGGQLIQEYYNDIKDHKGHKEYVKDLGNKLGLELTET